MMKLGVIRHKLHAPSKNGICEVLGLALKKTFENVSVKVVDCPDLTKEPFKLPFKGLCGDPAVLDVGGTPYLLPEPNMEKVYDVLDTAKWLDVDPPLQIIGAGASCSDGGLGELVVNLNFNKDGSIENETRTVQVNTKDDTYMVQHKPNLTKAHHLVNLYASRGYQDKVIEIRASQRISSEDFISSIRSALIEEYASDPIALGGVFVLKGGRAKIHVMPCYSATPLTTMAQVKDWIHYYEMPAPLVSFGYLLSSDPGLKLRMQHFHCYDTLGGNHGGHFHFDTTPEKADYLAYFDVAEVLCRVDMFQLDKSEALGM